MIGTIALLLVLAASTGIVIDLSPDAISAHVGPMLPDAIQQVLASWHPTAVGLALYALFLIVHFTVWNFRYIEFDPDEQQFHVKLCYGFIPVCTRHYRFDNIRHIDMKYDQNSFLSTIFSGRYGHMFGNEADIGAFTLMILMEDRTPVLVGRAWSERALRKTAERIGRMTGKRIM